MDAPDNDDGRERGDWKSTYAGAHGQIYFECIYLVITTVVSLSILWMLLSCAVALRRGDVTCAFCSTGFCDAAQPTILIVTLYFISGVLGASAFSTKWLYHTVARGTWHCDRLLWRLCVPLNGGILAIFVSFIFSKTVGVNFDRDTLAMPTLAQLAGFSFLIGVFADGVLAMLERLARNIFGTLETLSGK